MVHDEYRRGIWHAWRSNPYVKMGTTQAIRWKQEVVFTKRPAKLPKKCRLFFILADVADGMGYSGGDTGDICRQCVEPSISHEFQWLQTGLWPVSYVYWTNLTNPAMYLSHIPECTIQNRNVHISVLNCVLCDMGQVHCGICKSV